MGNLTASEALFGFCGWLTTRKEKTVMSSTNDCASIARLIETFCAVNKLETPREHWERELIHPGEQLGETKDA